MQPAARLTNQLEANKIGSAIQAGTAGINAADNIRGYYSGTCHNGRMMFDGKPSLGPCSTTIFSVKRRFRMDCLFCSIQEISDPSNPEDEIIDESENFYAKAALGHFVFGYTLIISKEHFLSYAYVPEDLFPELEAFRDNVLDKLHNLCEDPITILEHGAINRCQRGGSCIDHAHLHLMPLAADLYPLLSERFSFGELGSMSELRRFNDAQISYLYYQREGLRSQAVQLSQDVPSQLLRRLACQALGQPEMWDWRARPLRDVLQRFKSEYKRLAVTAPKVSRNGTNG